MHTKILTFWCVQWIVVYIMLLQALGCRETMHRIILPIFYQVLFKLFWEGFKENPIFFTSYLIFLSKSHILWWSFYTSAITTCAQQSPVLLISLICKQWNAHTTSPSECTGAAAVCGQQISGDRDRITWSYGIWLTEMYNGNDQLWILRVLVYCSVLSESSGTTLDMQCVQNYVLALCPSSSSADDNTLVTHSQVLIKHPHLHLLACMKCSSNGFKSELNESWANVAPRFGSRRWSLQYLTSQQLPVASSLFSIL